MYFMELITGTGKNSFIIEDRIVSRIKIKFLEKIGHSERFQFI